MSAKNSQSPENVQNNDYPMPAFYVSFGIIFLLGSTLITSPVWESIAPSWAEEAIKNKSNLLAMSAAMTMLLALILTIRPTGLAKYAAIGSGLLSFAAAISFDIEEIATALVMLLFVSPIYILALCQLIQSEEKVNWMSFGALVLYFGISAMAMLLSVPVLRDDLADSIIRGAIDSPEDLILFSLMLSVISAFLLTVIITLMILGWLRLLPTLRVLPPLASKYLHRKDHRTRAERRRAGKNR